MFTYVRLKNFLSLGDVIFDFRKTKTDTNRLVVVYGENGSGKTNFIQAFNLLLNSIHSFAFQQNHEKMVSILKDDNIPFRDIKWDLSLFPDFTEFLSSLRMVDCEEPAEVEYGFMMNDREAVYRLSFTDHIIKESLYGFTGKQRGFLFQFSMNEKEEITPRMQTELIRQSTYRKEVLERIYQYWGKHTFLSIILNQIKEKNRKFIDDNISPYFLSAIRLLRNLFVTSKLSGGLEKHIRFKEKEMMLENLDSGRMAVSMMPILMRTENILRDFFTQTYADIKDVQYQVTYLEDEKCQYQLFIDKMICGKIRKISFSQESAGTQQVLRIIRSLIGLFFGVTVVYDEIDNGVHDILLTQIISSLEEEITGQLIITTHNTMLLEEIDPHCVYIINADYMGNKSVHCAAEFDIQTNHNLRMRYLKGLLGGVPYVEGIDFDGIEQILAEGGAITWQGRPE